MIEHMGRDYIPVVNDI